MELARPSFKALRKTARVALSLHSKRYTYNGRVTSIFVAENPRAFRRAFVEASFAPRTFVAEGEGGTTLTVGGQLIARCSEAGNLVDIGTLVYSPVDLSPTKLADMAKIAFDDFIGLLHQRYAEIVGLPRGIHLHFDTDPCGYDVGWWIQHAPDGDGACVPSGLRFVYGAGGYGHSRKRVLRNLIASKISAFSSHLDAEGLHVLRRTQLCGHLPTVFAVLGEGCGAKRWRQALTAYPAALAYLIRRAANRDDGAMYDRYVEVIEKGQPLSDMLERDLGLSSSRLRRLRGVPPQRMGSVWRLEETLPSLETLPLHLWPRTRADYHALHKLSESLATTRLAGHLDRLLVGVRGGLGADKRLDALSHVKDVSHSLWEALDDGFELDVRAMHRVMDSLADLHLGRLVELISQWHRAHRAATLEATARLAVMRREIEALTWDCAMPMRVMTFGGVVATELTSPMQLLSEGNEVGHCVGSYYPDCLEGESRIISLSSNNGADRSTLELGVERGVRRRLVVRQHYSFRNSPVSPMHVTARKAVLRAIRDRGRLDWESDHGAASLEHLRRVDMVNRQVVGQYTQEVFFRALPALRQEIEARRALEDAKAA